VSLDLKSERGTALDAQELDWKDFGAPPYSKLDADAFSRVRVILLNGIESEALRFQHMMARCQDGELRRALARIRRKEQHQQTMVNWLNPADQSPLETTIGYEQVAIEVTAHLAQHEPDPYLAQVYRFGLLEDFDHMYRYAALLDRLEGKDANAILQGYTDVLPGRPTAEEHRAPEDDLRDAYDRRVAMPISKLNALTLVAGEHQTHDYYMHVGPLFADPVARQLYAEIASIEEQHVTQYESLADPTETWLEKWLLHEATEVWNYWSCLQHEGDPRLKKIWQRFLDWELGHLAEVRRLFERLESRDPWEIVPATLPDPIRFESHREFVRETCEREVDLRASGTRFVPREEEPQASIAYRERLNARGSPSETVARGWAWRPGGELLTPEAAEGAAVH
jgi:rubrerythrin